MEGHVIPIWQFIEAEKISHVSLDLSIPQLPCIRAVACFFCLIAPLSTCRLRLGGSGCLLITPQYHYANISVGSDEVGA